MTTTAERPDWATADTDLTGKTVLVLGGAGGVGEGITRSLLDAGATVIATARAQPKLDDLTERVAHPALRTRALDLLEAGLDDTVAEIVERHGRLDGAVVAVADYGISGRKRIIDMTDAEWDRVVQLNQAAPFRAFRSVVPALVPGGALVHINGFSAEVPYPGIGVGGSSSAATKALTRTLAEELKDDNVRVYEVILGFIRTRPRQLAGVDNPAWIPAAHVGTHVAELLAGNSPLAATVLQYFVTRDQGPSPTPPEIG